MRVSVVSLVPVISRVYKAWSSAAHATSGGSCTCKTNKTGNVIVLLDSKGAHNDKKNQLCSTSSGELWVRKKFDQNALLYIVHGFQPKYCFGKKGYHWRVHLKCLVVSHANVHVR